MFQKSTLDIVLASSGSKIPTRYLLEQKTQTQNKKDTSCNYLIFDIVVVNTSAMLPRVCQPARMHTQAFFESTQISKKTYSSSLSDSSGNRDPVFVFAHHSSKRACLAQQLGKDPKNHLEGASGLPAQPEPTNIFWSWKHRKHTDVS